jgi:hypothetical protein
MSQTPPESGMVSGYQPNTALNGRCVKDRSISDATSGHAQAGEKLRHVPQGCNQTTPRAGPPLAASAFIVTCMMGNHLLLRCP